LMCRTSLLLVAGLSRFRILLSRFNIGGTWFKR
jgi:hypothetical protein